MIVIDMDMPKSCCECPMCHPKGKDEPWNYACFQEMMDINLDEWDEKRHPNCPIKCDIEDIKDNMKEEIASKESGKPMIQNCGLSLELEIIDKHTKGDTDARNSN